jgi:hypothetical protein
MNPPGTKLRFHLSLYLAYLLKRETGFAEIPKEPVRAGDTKSLKAFFWTPTPTAGANVIVHDMLPSLKELTSQLAPGWDICAGSTLPNHAVDWLICFKAVPPKEAVAGRKVLLICDQAEVFWDRMADFDAVIATSSRPFAGLLASRHPHVAFIPESEPRDYLEFGRDNLATPPAKRGEVLLWHGGQYSLDGLAKIRRGLERWAAETTAQLHVVSGKQPARTEKWGALTVHYFPWSKAQLQASARAARLGLVPARFSLKNSWLKPASRVRCLFALGVPVIGDGRVPDVVEFMASINGPLANSPATWEAALRRQWNEPETLAQLAARGHAMVADQYSTDQTARQWFRYFATNPSATT